MSSPAAVFPEPAVGSANVARRSRRDSTDMSTPDFAWSNIKVLVRKNVELKKAQYCSFSCSCVPCTLIWELIFPMGIIFLFAYLKTLSDPVTTLDGWEQTWDEGDSREHVPLQKFSTDTARASFMKTTLLPLHLRPRYKLALAAASAADVPQVEAFRAWVTANWFPRQLLPIVPCLPTQDPRVASAGNGRSNRGERRRAQAAAANHGRPESTNVRDLADRYRGWPVSDPWSMAVECWACTCIASRPYRRVLKTGQLQLAL